MPEMHGRTYTVEVRLIQGEGVCVAGHKIGENWVFPGETERLFCPTGICIHALASMLPKLLALRYGATFPWLRENPDVALHPCPDTKNPHIFQLRRIRSGG